MENTDILMTYFRNLPDGQDIIFKFFITFARFECALKNSPNYLTEERGSAKADWNKFIKNIDNFNPDSSPELKTAVEYILSNPPKKQSVLNNKLFWNDSILSDPSILQKLNVYIRRIRNNLLHGGKFNENYNPEVSRNFKLLNSALIIMNNWIDLNPEIKILYSSDIL